MVNTLQILFPLYIYPTDCTVKSTCAWLPLYNAIEAFPGIQFTAVIDPSNGPGNTTFPVAEYIGGIGQLNSYDNVRTIGYVDSAQGLRTVEDYQADISKYANWATYADADIAMGGIFVDDMLNQDTPTNLDYYSAFSQAIQDTMPSGSQFIVMNPGATLSEDFFAYADVLVTFENTYANTFVPFTVFTDPFYAGLPRSQEAAILYDFTGTVSDLQNITDYVGATEQFGYMHVTTGGDYNSFSTLWSQFVNAVSVTNAE